MRFQEEWLELIGAAADLTNVPDPRVATAFSRIRDERESYGVRQQLAALSWVFRIAVETEQLNRVAAEVPWLDRLAIGFITPEADGRAADFGVIAHVDHPAPLAYRSRFGKVLDRGMSIKAAGREFPVAVRIATRIPQAATVSPSRARATCWVQHPLKSIDGWLVPFHAVSSGGRFAPRIVFDDGSSGVVVENYGECIDAVVVDSSLGAPPALRRMWCARGIGPGTAVTVEDRFGFLHSCTVLDIDVSLGVVSHPLFPIRFSYDWASSAKGDSGALVMDSTVGQPLGMHQGALRAFATAGAPSTVAYGLCLYQLEDYAGLEVHQ